MVSCKSNGDWFYGRGVTDSFPPSSQRHNRFLISAPLHLCVSAFLSGILPGLWVSELLWGKFAGYT
jgi:hypothetical protein